MVDDESHRVSRRHAPRPARRRAALLDSGGPDAVTLREVGARAGVSRGAPYRHFANKESLLTAVAAEGWERIGDQMHELQTDSRLLPSTNFARRSSASLPSAASSRTCTN